MKHTDDFLKKIVQLSGNYRQRGNRHGAKGKYLSYVYI
jgi:hypothetical protein